MRYLSRTQDERCMADIKLRDGSDAQCQRYRAVGTYCKQHAGMLVLSCWVEYEGETYATSDPYVAAMLCWFLELADVPYQASLHRDTPQLA